MSATIRIGRRRIEISHPDKIMFPAPRLTKLDLAHHYERVSALIRPLFRVLFLTLQF